MNSVLVALEKLVEGVWIGGIYRLVRALVLTSSFLARQLLSLEKLLLALSNHLIRTHTVWSVDVQRSLLAKVLASTILWTFFVIPMFLMALAGLQALFFAAVGDWPLMERIITASAILGFVMAVAEHLSRSKNKYLER